MARPNRTCKIYCEAGETTEKKEKKKKKEDILFHFLQNGKTKHNT